MRLNLRGNYRNIVGLAGFFLGVLMSGAAWGQPTVLGTQLVNGSYATYDLNTVGGFKQYRLQASSSAAISTRNWEFATGTSGAPSYTTNWRPNTSGNTLSPDLFIPTSFANGAKYNTGSGGSSGLLPVITSGNYYTFNVSTNAAADNVMAMLETSFNPVTVSTVTSAAGTYGSRVVSITTSGTPNANERIYVRYTTNAFVSSTIVQATGSGTSWSATIPWQSSAVTYYVYTSNKAATSINADVTTYSTQSVHDMATLNLNNNGGANYTWSPAAGPIIVTSTGGTAANTPTSYATFTGAGGAIAALNGGTIHTGTVTILITADVTTETGAVALNNSAAWTSIGVNPSGARTISGTLGNPLFDFNGADNVTIDGLNSGGNSLTISNTNTGTTAATLRFLADATNNTVTNCTISGSGTGTATGTIFFSTGTTTGNTGNTISNNTITAAGGNSPVNGIYSLGTSAAIPNTVTVSCNSISDYFHATNATAGINVTATGNTGWTISNNKLFQTATRIYTGANTHNGIFVGTGSGYTISGNTIGFANSGGTGTTNMVGNTVALTGTFPSSYTTTGTANATRYIGINCAFTAGGTNSLIQSNIIAGFALYTSSGATTTNGICYVDTAPDTIGSGCPAGSIQRKTSNYITLYQ